MSRVAIMLLLAPLLVLGGCAYSFDSTYDDETIRTVAVPMFGNTTFYPGLEAQLTEAITAEIRSATPWKITTPDRADTRLDGTIKNVRLRTLSTRRGTGLVEEQSYTVTVDFSWSDARTGDSLVARDGFSASATFMPTSEAGEFAEVGQRGAIRELARDIVTELRTRW